MTVALVEHRSNARAKLAIAGGGSVTLQGGRTMGEASRKGDEMMNGIFRLIFACFALGSASTGHAAQASDMAPCAPNEPQELRTLKGFLIAHVACNRVLLEIPVQMLDRSILVYTEFTALSTGASE